MPYKHNVSCLLTTTQQATHHRSSSFVSSVPPPAAAPGSRWVAAAGALAAAGGCCASSSRPASACAMIARPGGRGRAQSDEDGPQAIVAARRKRSPTAPSDRSHGFTSKRTHAYSSPDPGPALEREERCDMAQPALPRPQGRLRVPGWANNIFTDSNPLFGRRQDSRPDAMRRNLVLLATAALGVVAAQEAGVAAPAQVRQSCNMAANTSPARGRPPSRGTHAKAAMFHTWTPA